MGPDQVNRRDATSLAQEKRLPRNGQFRTASQFTLAATHAENRRLRVHGAEKLVRITVPPGRL